MNCKCQHSFDDHRPHISIHESAIEFACFAKARPNSSLSYCECLKYEQVGLIDHIKHLRDNEADD